jgi:hypothetical protein
VKKERKNGNALRARLIRAVARELYFQMTPPDAPRSRRGAAKTTVWKTGPARLNPDGSISQEGVAHLEAVLSELESECQSRFQEVFAFLSNNYPGAEAPVKHLLAEGANPVWIIDDCLHLRGTTLPGQTRRRAAALSQVKSVSRRFARLADDYSVLFSVLGIRLHADVEAVATGFLRGQSQLLTLVAQRATERGPSAHRLTALVLAEHLMLTTGSYQDHEVCRLLDAVRPKANGAHWTPGALQQYRSRQRRAGGGAAMFPLFRDIAAMIDQHITTQKQRFAAARRSWPTVRPVN